MSVFARLGDWMRSVSAKPGTPDWNHRLDEVRDRIPVPVLWLYGKTQSGKTSIMRFLTGATDAEIGNGFRPCTRFSREYPFPDADTPLMRFLDTRGLGEPGYAPDEDIAQFDAKAHLVIVTVRVRDHAVDELREGLRKLRDAKPSRPVLLVLTCLHEVAPEKQHVQPYPFGTATEATAVSEDMRRAIAGQTEAFAGLVDAMVPIDLTHPDEGYTDRTYGGEALKQAILHQLPNAYRQTLAMLDRTTGEWGDQALREARPTILTYTALAVAAGTIPIPFVDLLLLPGLQTQMVRQLGERYGQPLTAERFGEMASAMGIGLLTRQALREVTKAIPIVGSAVSGAMAGASTYALGRAFCYYYREVREGHLPQAEDLKAYFEKELNHARSLGLGTWFG